MFKYYNPLLSKNGDVLPGRYVRLFTAGGAEVDLFADESGTPISTESGVANAAVSDTLGMVRFYVANGTYDLRLYDEGDNFVSAEVGVPMLDAGGVYDDLASTDAEKGAALVKFSSGDTVEDLASGAAGKGAALVTMEGGGSAEAAILARPTTAALASSTGAEGVGFGDRFVSDELAERIPITRAPGIVGDGVTDDSVAIRDFLTANKGKTITFPTGRSFMFGSILMSGSDWNGTRIIVEEGCECILLPRGGASATLHGAWAMFAFQATDDCGVDVRGWLNGNRANQSDNTNIHMLILAGIEDFSLPNFRVREYQGDGLYVTIENQFDPYGRNSKRLIAGRIYGYNSAPAGRNLVSIISLEDSSFDSITGINVGGFVQGSYQPGGFDIEPNNSSQRVNNITVGSINVTGHGQSMVAIHGRPESTDITTNVIIGQSRAVNTIPAESNDGAGNQTQNGGTTLRLRWCSDVVIGDHSGQHSASYGIGVDIMAAVRPKIRARVAHVHTALNTSAGGYTLQTITDPDIVVDGTDLCRFGAHLFKIEGGRIGGRLSDPKDSTYYTSRFAVVGGAGGTLTNTALSFSMTGNANWTRSYRHDGATYTNAVIADCDLSGSAWAGQTQQVGDMQVPRRNVAGVTAMAAKPTAGTWKTGDFVSSSVATTATGKVLVGWKRLTDGTGQVLNTDWKEVWGTDA